MASTVWSPFFPDIYEEFNTRQENWDSDNPTVTVTLRCKMSDRYIIVADIVGMYREYPEVTPVPLFALNGSVRFDKARKSAEATGTRYVAGYDALISITYGHLPGALYYQSVEPDWPEYLYAEEVLETNVQFVNRDYTEYAWSANKITNPLFTETTLTADTNVSAQKPDEAIGRAFYKVSISRMVKGYLNPPFAYYDPGGLNTGDPLTALPFNKWPGWVHNRKYVSDRTGETYEAGTLLFVEPTMEYGPYLLRYLDPAVGTTPLGKTWRMTGKFLYQEMGWNAFWRETCDSQGNDTSGWYALLYKKCTANGTDFTVAKPFRNADMSEFIFSGANATVVPPINYPPEIPWPPVAP